MGARHSYKFDAERKQVFLKHYAEWGLLNQAAAAAGIDPSTVLNHVKADPIFKAEYEKHKSDFFERLEHEAVRRAVEGVEEPIYQRGELVGHKVVYSDNMLSLILKAHIPRYRDKITADLNHKGAVLVVPAPSEDSHDWEKRQRDGGDTSDEESPGR